LAKAEISSGQCRFTTTVEATRSGRSVQLKISSTCEAVQRLAEALTEVDPFREVSYRGEGPLILELARKHLKHPACPVPCGMIKTVEVAAGMGLPVDAAIKLQK
jgi:hypothetical protein